MTRVNLVWQGQKQMEALIGKGSKAGGPAFKWDLLLFEHVAMCKIPVLVLCGIYHSSFHEALSSPPRPPLPGTSIPIST